MTFTEIFSHLCYYNNATIIVGEIIETLEEVCQWLHNVYPQKSRDEISVTDQSTSWTEEITREVSQSITDLLPIKKKNGTGNQVTILIF